MSTSKQEEKGLRTTVTVRHAISSLKEFVTILRVYLYDDHQFESENDYIIERVSYTFVKLGCNRCIGYTYENNVCSSNTIHLAIYMMYKTYTYHLLRYMDIMHI